jgi:hypothetical protein
MNANRGHPRRLTASLLRRSETAIFVPNAGTFAGEYVAACAASVCGYIGELLCCTYSSGPFAKFVVGIERLYEKSGLLIKKYPRRREVVSSTV